MTCEVPSLLVQLAGEHGDLPTVHSQGEVETNKKSPCCSCWLEITSQAVDNFDQHLLGPGCEVDGCEMAEGMNTIVQSPIIIYVEAYPVRV